MFEESVFLRLESRRSCGASPAVLRPRVSPLFALDSASIRSEFRHNCAAKIAVDERRLLARRPRRFLLARQISRWISRYYPKSRRCWRPFFIYIAPPCFPASECVKGMRLIWQKSSEIFEKAGRRDCPCLILDAALSRRIAQGPRGFAPL